MQVDAFALPGHEICGTIEITYHIPDGVQSAQHPSPGRPYHGTTRTAYLPYNPEGKEVLGVSITSYIFKLYNYPILLLFDTAYCNVYAFVIQLLKRAFDCGLIFTVGTSVTSGKPNTVVWNDVHHKTSRGGGS